VLHTPTSLQPVRRRYLSRSHWRFPKRLPPELFFLLRFLTSLSLLRGISILRRMGPRHRPYWCPISPSVVLFLSGFSWAVLLPDKVNTVSLLCHQLYMTDLPLFFNMFFFSLAAMRRLNAFRAFFLIPVCLVLLGVVASFRFCFFFPRLFPNSCSPFSFTTQVFVSLLFPPYCFSITHVFLFLFQRTLVQFDSSRPLYFFGVSVHSLP